VKVEGSRLCDGAEGLGFSERVSGLRFCVRVEGLGTLGAIGPSERTN
jgi:hypothetical protein